jgi:predicted kinase
MDKKLIMTRGLPGSGKSTWAKAEKARIERDGQTSVIIVTKDDIRKAHSLTGWKWSPEGEKEILMIRDSCIRGAFKQGADVVISADTNFGGHKNRLMELAKQNNATFEVKDFSHIPVTVCIEQDSKRPEAEQVGPTVIKNMYNKYLAVDDIVAYVPDVSKPAAIICDLDGTLATHNRRSPYDYARCGEDSVNEAVASIVATYAKNGYAILYVSGREAWSRQVTADWLTKHNLPFGEPHKLMMRATADNRKDYIVKNEIFDRLIRNEYNIKFVLDDRDQVVKMWRGLGLACLQVNYGAF